MDKDQLAQQLAKVMDAVTECEGLIYADMDGNVLMGQTLLDLDINGIAKAIASMFSTVIKSAEKGNVLDLTIGLDTGYIVAARKENEILIGLLGEDGKTAVGLLARQLKNIMK